VPNLELWELQAVSCRSPPTGFRHCRQFFVSVYPVRRQVRCGICIKTSKSIPFKRLLSLDGTCGSVEGRLNGSRNALKT
jgi:hypothetical protein